MATDDLPKSALELAMERLRRSDAGAAEPPLSDAQKAAIAEARNVYAAKVAEIEILHRSKLASMFDPAERERAEAEYRHELQRLGEECDRKVRRIRADGH
jgi:hypothetical protein